MNSASRAHSSSLRWPRNLRFGHRIRRPPIRRPRALRALATDSTHGCPGARDLPHLRFVRAADRAPSVTLLAPDLVASLTGRSRAPYSDIDWLCGRARLRTPRFVPARPITALAIVPCRGPRQPGPRRARWGLTQRSTGRAGTRLDLRSPSRRRAGYLQR